MSEQPGEYKTEVEAALTMLGVGYDENKPAVIIEKPRKDLALRESGLSEYKVWGWVKKSAKFIFHVRRLRGAKLSIWEVVSLSINEEGECALSLGDLVKLTGYSRSEVSESVKELEEMGYLSVQKEAGKKSIFKPSFTARGENSPSDEPIQKTDGLTHPVSKDSHPSSFSNINSAPSIIRVKRVNTAKIKGIEAAMFADRPVTEEDLDTTGEASALKAFETAMHLPGNWQWYPGKSTDEAGWKDLRAVVVKIYQSEGKKGFEDYHKWAHEPYSRGAMTVLAIKQNPGNFEASWMAFKASAMFRKEEIHPEHKPYKPEEKNYVPRPANLKPVIRKPAE